MKHMVPPAWLQAVWAGSAREQLRLRQELGKIRGVLPLLMKPRNGGVWTAEERAELKTLLRSASSLGPYLVVLALPGSVVFLPFLAWRLDVRRNRRQGLPPEAP